MIARENYISYLEKNGFDELALGQSQGLARIYNARCKMIADDEISKRGKIPPEAIEMYNKHFELLQRVQNKYPQDAKDFVNFYKRSDCHKLIRNHSPEHYKGDPQLRQDK